MGAKNYRKQRNYLERKQALRCYYCQCKLQPQYFTYNDKSRRKGSIDHMIPVSRGGTHDLDNLCLACVNCNQLKGDMTDKEFFVYLRKIRPV